MKNQKVILTVAIVLVILVVGGILWFVVSQNDDSNTSTVTNKNVTVNDNGNVNQNTIAINTNSEININVSNNDALVKLVNNTGYQISYPESYVDDNLYSIWNSYTKGIFDSLSNFGINRGQETLISISVYPKEKKQEVVEYYDYTILEEPIMIDDKIGYKMNPARIIIEENNNIYIIYSSFMNMDNNEEYVNILNSIEFIDSTANTNTTINENDDWQTYNDSENGLSLLYPNEFTVNEDNDAILFNSPDGHFWYRKVENTNSLSISSEIKDDYYANDTYGYQYQDSFIQINGIDIYKQGRYDLGVIENYRFVLNNKIVSFSFEFNFDVSDEALKSKYTNLIKDIINSVSVN